MKIILSPAKSLNFTKELPTNNFSESLFLKESKQIHKILKQQSPQELSCLMGISDTLAMLNWQRNQDWKPPFNHNNARPAVFAFDGDVYAGLDAYNIPLEKLDLLQNHVRILSGLYGLLKPLDLMQPYRLEMGTKLAIGERKNLYEFWRPIIAKALNKEMNAGELLINLASVEYFSVINSKELKAELITPEFKEYRDGKPKIISFFAKKARGLMARYIIDTMAKTREDLMGFNYDGYQYDGYLSLGNQFIFTR